MFLSSCPTPSSPELWKNWVTHLQSETLVQQGVRKSPNEWQIAQKCNTKCKKWFPVCQPPIAKGGADVCFHTFAFHQQKLCVCDEKLILYDIDHQILLLLSILAFYLLFGSDFFVWIWREKNWKIILSFIHLCNCPCLNNCFSIATFL